VQDLIKVENNQEISVLTLNRPEARNALSKALLLAFHKELNAIKKNKSLRVLIITGAGEKAFCAGADLKERQGMSIEETRAAVALIKSCTNAIADLAMPTIAAINGDAFGGGLEIALACDMRIAAQSASMGLTECALGIIPGAGGTLRLPQVVGLPKALELIFKASRLNSSDALNVGLVNACSADDQLMPTALSWAQTIAGNAPLAIRAAKRAILFSSRNFLELGLASEDAAYEEIIHSEDRLEGLRAFQEKRKPHFKGI
jgi:enoyl-CoA hydratase/carnithine racemase